MVIGLKTAVKYRILLFETWKKLAHIKNNQTDYSKNLIKKHISKYFIAACFPFSALCVAIDCNVSIRSWSFSCREYLHK